MSPLLVMTYICIVSKNWVEHNLGNVDKQIQPFFKFYYVLNLALNLCLRGFSFFHLSAGKFEHWYQFIQNAHPG